MEPTGKVTVEITKNRFNKKSGKNTKTGPNRFDDKTSLQGKFPNMTGKRRLGDRKKANGAELF